MISPRSALRALRRRCGAAVGRASTACSLVGTGGTHDAGGKDVVLVTHDSFVLPKPLIARFDRESGYHLVVHAAGDGGTLTNKLVLTKGEPDGRRRVRRRQHLRHPGPRRGRLRAVRRVAAARRRAGT